ncbi:MAG: GNAT family N-acetyltransferase [Planctomycetota bacterium]|jgi:ribosomal protein S18 acetylase RimI-like enzyme
MDTDSVRLRPARADELEFLRTVHREAMRPHIEATWGFWDESVQRKRFDDKTDPSTHEVIEFAGRPIGCRWVSRHPDALELVRLWILPEAQGRGIGTFLVRRLLAEAARSHLAVRLRVMKVNPAHRLYRRLGFRIAGETETHYLMEVDG